MDNYKLIPIIISEHEATCEREHIIRLECCRKYQTDSNSLLADYISNFNVLYVNMILKRFYHVLNHLYKR